MFPTDKAERKKHPIFSGVLAYFPRTIIALAKCSWVGNEQHNPGEKLHWARGKSNDHEDCMLRHTMEGDALDDDGIYHCVKAAWRALARAELILDKIAHRDACDDFDEMKAAIHGETPPPPPETRVLDEPEPQRDVIWKGKKIGHTAGSQALFQCPHCQQVVTQSKYTTSCVKCGGAVV